MSNKYSMLINGEPADCVDGRDRGLHYGDGVFETMAFINQGIRLFDQHYQRLQNGCERLGIAVPSQAEVVSDIEKLNADDSCIIKLIVTRGVGGFGYLPNETEDGATRVIQKLPWPAPKARDASGLHIDVLRSTLAASPQLAGLKHLNRLEQVIAAREMRERNLDEGLVCNQEGFIIEAVSSNVVFVFDNQFVTPKLDAAGVCGVAREVLIQQAQLSDVEIAKEYLYSDVAQQADEIILCNSIRGCRAVQRIGEREITARAGFQQLNAWFQSAVSC